MGTAAAGPLTGVGQKYTDTQLIALLRTPSSKMTNGGMTAVDLKQDDLEALAAYLRQLR
jgi:cytochrome c553